MRGYDNNTMSELVLFSVQILNIQDERTFKISIICLLQFHTEDKVLGIGVNI